MKKLFFALLFIPSALVIAGGSEEGGVPRTNSRQDGVTYTEAPAAPNDDAPPKTKCSAMVLGALFNLGETVILAETKSLKLGGFSYAIQRLRAYGQQNLQGTLTLKDGSSASVLCYANAPKKIDFKATRRTRIEGCTAPKGCFSLQQITSVTLDDFTPKD